MQRASETILVTGGCGFIGTHLCSSLVQSGHQVLALDLKPPEKPVRGVQYTRGDVRSASTLEPLVQQATSIFHFAATVSVPLCQQDPIESYSNNFDCTLRVLEMLRKHPGRRLIFASTAALYGNQGDDGRALKEEDTALEFTSFYAAQKHASEQAIGLYRRVHDIDSLIFRFFNVYGPGQDPTSPYSGVMTLFSRLAANGETLVLNGGGNQTRDFISVGDIVDACAKSLSLPRSAWDAKPINLGSGKTIKIQELAKLICESARSSSSVVSGSARDGDVQHSLADISKARRILNFNPGLDLTSGLEDLIQSFL